MTVSSGELAETIFNWLEATAPRQGRTWRTRTLHEDFLMRFEAIYEGARALTVLQLVTEQLADALQAQSSTVATFTWGRDLARPDQTIDALPSIITRLRRAADTLPALKDNRQQGGDVAQKIVDAVEEAIHAELERERAAAMPDKLPPHADISALFGMPGQRAQRRHSVRTFLLFFALAIAALSVHTVLDRTFFLHPTTLIFIWLGYLTLIATFLAHGRRTDEH